MIKKSMKRLALTVAVLMTLVGVTPTPAQATALVAYDCASSSWFCLYDLANGTGTRYVVVEPPGHGPLCVPIPTWFNDRASSVRNNTFGGATVYEHGNCTGRSQFVPARQQGPLTQGSLGMTDKTSALYWPG